MIATLQKTILASHPVKTDSALFILRPFKFTDTGDKGAIDGSSPGRSFMGEPAFRTAGTVALVKVAAWDISESSFVNIISVVSGFGRGWLWRGRVRNGGDLRAGTGGNAGS